MLSDLATCESGHSALTDENRPVPCASRLTLVEFGIRLHLAEVGRVLEQMSFLPNRRVDSSLMPRVSRQSAHRVRSIGRPRNTLVRVTSPARGAQYESSSRKTVLQSLPQGAVRAWLQDSA